MDPQLTGVLRTLAASGFGYAAAKGWIPAGDYSDFIASIGVVAVGLWSIVEKRSLAK